MKKLYFFLLALCIMGMSCNKEQSPVDDNNEDEIEVDSTQYISVWEYTSVRNDVVITLTIDSLLSKWYVITAPPRDICYPYIICDGEWNYFLHGDTFHLCYHPDVCDKFIRTMLSPDSMRLLFYGGMSTTPFVREYYFIRQKSND